MTLETIAHNFTYHAPTEEKVAKHEQVRMGFRNLAIFVNSICPESRELSLALTKLEESVFWANAAIARNP